MTSVAELLQQVDVTTAAWRLALDVSNGKQIHRDAAVRTLIAAGATAETAATLRHHHRDNRTTHNPSCLHQHKQSGLVSPTTITPK
jgi:hypothetical protein